VVKLQFADTGFLYILFPFQFLWVRPSDDLCRCIGWIDWLASDAVSSPCNDIGSINDELTLLLSPSQ